MQLIKGKQCRKCNSKNVFFEYDLGRWYEHCLICGYIVPLEEIKVTTGEAVKSTAKQKKA